jgi:hypothetical protein
MTRTLCALALTAMLIPLALTQDGRVAPPLTARENPQAASTGPATEHVLTTSSKSLPFCPPKTCLYYAGDFNSADSNANGLLNGFVPNSSVGGEVWVGVKPPPGCHCLRRYLQPALYPRFRGYQSGSLLHSDRTVSGSWRRTGLQHLRQCHSDSLRRIRLRVSQSIIENGRTI